MNRAVVLDTNILVSAGIHLGGPPARMVDLALEGEILAFTCPTVVEEYLEVLNRDRFSRHLFPPEWFPVFLKVSTLREKDPPDWPLQGPDPDDLVFLSLAHQEGAVLVTGNVRDYPSAIRRKVQVVTPREFLDSWIGWQI